MKDRDADMLRDLAGLRTARSAGRLARFQVRIDDLKSKVEALRAADETAPASIVEARVRDKWSIWRTTEVIRLNGEIARLEAQAQPLREANARDQGREAVLERLMKGK